jgi:hypothetical protein
MTTTGTPPPQTADPSAPPRRQLARAHAEPEVTHADARRAPAPPRRAPPRPAIGILSAPPSATYMAERHAAETFARNIRSAIDVLAPALGLDPSRVRVTLRPGPGDMRGHAANDAVTIAGSLDASDAVTRPVVAHELVHLRQHRNRTEPDAPAPDTTAAEAEAAGLAAALLEGRALWVPRHVLPDGHVARYDDGSGIAPATPASTATTPDVTKLEQTLDTYVATNHSADLRLITGQLDHPWTQTDEQMIENALNALANLQFVVARSLVRALEQPVRIRLARLRDGHHGLYPEACVAVLSACSAEELLQTRQFNVRDRLTYAGITAALHGVDPARLSVIATRALLATIRRLPVDTIVELEKTDQRDVFRSLLSSGPDNGTDEKELLTAIDSEKELSRRQAGGGSDIVDDQLTKLLQDANDEHARDALKALRSLALDATSNASPGAAQPKPLPGSNAPPDPMPALTALVARLDTKGLIDKLLDELPEDDRYSETYLPVLRYVLAARAPLPNLARATKLLSYGLFDWAVTDSETRFAYLLVKSTPIAAQDSWRSLENGKWLHRLEDNVPDFMFTTGEYTGVGSEYIAGPGDIPGMAAGDLQKKADDFIARFENRADDNVSRDIVRSLVGLAPDGTPQPWITDATKGPADNDKAVRQAVVRRIDARLKLDKIIEKVPDDYLFSEQGRNELRDLNQLRDIVHLVQQARSLVPDGWLGWITYTHRDAWLAAQAVRGLAPDQQRSFATQNPGLWRNIWIGLTEEMRRVLPTTLATGRDERLPTRDALRERLRDKRLWTEAMKSELRALIDLALAADDRAVLFDISKEMRADQVKELADIVDHFQLYSEADKRTVFRPELTKTPWSSAPVWTTGLGAIIRGIGILLFADYLFSDKISLSGKTMHLKGFDLADAQTVLGGLGGVELAPSKGGANAIDVDATFEAGFVVNVDLKDLEIKGVNIVLPGKSFKTGPVSVKGLKVTGGFSDRHYRDPTYLAATLESLVVNDFVIVDPTLPLSGAWAIARLALQALKFRASQDASTDPLDKIGQQLPKDSFVVPIWGRAFQLLENLVALKGGIPFDYTVLDYMLLPFNIPPGLSTLVSFPLNKALPTPQPLSNLWGLASDGVLRPPRSAAERMGDAIAMMRAWSVSFTSLNVDGISIGAGQQIKSLLLTDVNLSIGQSLPAYLNTAIATLTQAQKKLAPDSQQYKDLGDRIAALRTQAAAVEATPRLTELRDKRKHDPGKLTDDERKELALADERAQDEGRLAELEAKDRWNPGSLTDAERAQLVELTKRLRSDVGVVAEIGGIQLGPLTGNIQSLGVAMKGVHLQAKVPNVGLLPLASAPGYLDDRSLAEQFKAGGAKTPSVGELAKRSEFSLVIDSTEMVQTDPAQPAVIIAAKKIPPSGDLRKQLDALPAIPGNAPVRERLREAYETVVDLEMQRAIVDSKDLPDGQRAIARQRALELTERAKRLLGVEIGGIKFGRITGELDPTTGALTATVHDTEITDLAGPGFNVAKITGSLEARLAAQNITARPDQLKSTDPMTLAGQLAPSLGLKDVTATGISLAQGSIASAKIGHLTGSLQATKTGFRIPDLALDHLETDGVSLGKEGDGLTAETVTLDGLALDAEVELEQTSTGTELTRAVIHSLSIGSLGGEHVVLEMPQEKGSIRAELIGGALHDITATEVELAKGSEGMELVSGSATVGSFADLRYSVALGALKHRTKVSGTLTTAPDAVKAKRPTIRANYATAGGRKFSLSLADLEALGTDISTPDGKVTIRKVTLAADITGTDKGVKASATLSDLNIGPIDWRVGTARVHGSGPIIVKKITIAASYTPAVPAVDKKKGKPAVYTVSDVVLTGIEGSDLRYTDLPIDMHLGRDDKPADGKPPLTIGRIHLTPTHMDLSDLSADVGGAVADKVSVQGHVGLKSMTMDLMRDGHIVAHVTGLSGDAKVTGDTYSLNAELKSTDIDTIDIGPDAIRFGSGAGKGGVHIDALTLSSISVSAAIAGHKFTLKTLENGNVDLIDINTTVRVDRWGPKEKHGPKEYFKQIAIERFDVDRVNLSALQLDLPDAGLTVIVPVRNPGDEPTLHSLSLFGESSPEFIIKPNWDFFGGAQVESISLPINAAIKGKFKGDVTITTGKASVGFLEAGGVKVDIANPKLAMSTAAELGDPKTRLRVAKIGADKLTFADGRLYVKHPVIEDVEYEQLVGGHRAVWIKIKRADMPEANYTTGPAGELVIPSLDISEAFFAMDVPSLAKKPAVTDPGKGAKTSPTFDMDALRPIVDEIEGKVQVVMFASASAGGLKDFQIGTDSEPLEVLIKHGAIDAPALQKNLKGKVTATAIDEGWQVRPWLVEHFAKEPKIRMKGSRLQLGVYIIDPDPTDPYDEGWFEEILAWELTAPDYKKVLKGWQVPVWAAIFEMADDPPDKDPKKAAEKKKKSQAVKDSLEIRKLLADLDVKNQAPLHIKITSTTVNGSVVLSKEAIMRLHVEGGISSVAPPPPERKGSSPDKLDFSLQGAKLDSADLQIGDNIVHTGSITIENMRDGSLTFDDLMTPRRVTATITKAHANNIRWYKP